MSIIPVCGDADALRKLPKSVTFDAAFVSTSASDFLSAPSFAARVTPGTSVVSETARFCVPLKKDERKKFAKAVHDIAVERGWAPAYDVAGGEDKAPADETAATLKWVVKY